MNDSCYKKKKKKLSDTKISLEFLDNKKKVNI
jgi:hypothetical protein